MVAIAGAAAVAGLAAGLGVLVFNKHPATISSATRSVAAALSGPTGLATSSVTFGPGDILAAGGNDGRTYLWNTSTKETIATLASPASTGVNSVALGPGGTVLAAGDHNGRTYLWNIAYHKT